MKIFFGDFVSGLALVPGWFCNEILLPWLCACIQRWDKNWSNNHMLDKSKFFYLSTEKINCLREKMLYIQSVYWRCVVNPQSVYCSWQDVFKHSASKSWSELASSVSEPSVSLVCQCNCNFIYFSSSLYLFMAEFCIGFPQIILKGRTLKD